MRWAIVRLGALAAWPAAFPVALSAATLASGDAATRAAHTYDVLDPVTGATLAAAADPTAAPHRWKRPPVGRMSPADFGLAHTGAGGAAVLTWINETPESEACGE